MESTINLIPVPYSDAPLNKMIQSSNGTGKPYVKHFTHKEEFFLKFDEEFEVFSLPIHHDIRNVKPSTEYLKSIRSTFEQIFHFAPSIFSELNYFFNPGEVLTPSFFQVFKIKELYYLYLLKVDLQFKPSDQILVNQGTNDESQHYKSNKLFIDADLIPLTDIKMVKDRINGFYINQLISSTWIRETGRGYSVQGIWIDHELTKFFTKLFLNPQYRYYPYYPFQCKYKTLIYNFIALEPDERKREAARLHRALSFLNTDKITTIQKNIKNREFSVDLPIFKELKSQIPQYWHNTWDPYKMKAYLNEQGQKEFLIELEQN